jgi:hypothetical protein
MALEITSSSSNRLSFTLTDTQLNTSLSLNDSISSVTSYTYGTGVNEITNAATITGVLPSGGSTQVDLYSFPQTTFDSSQSIQFTGVKNFSVYNTSTTEGYDFTVASTGSNACTNLFNGGSGNLLVKPYSGFTYNDPYDGFVVSSGQRYVYLDDLGSGVTYKIFVLGLD